MPFATSADPDQIDLAWHYSSIRQRRFLWNVSKWLHVKNLYHKRPGRCVHTFIITTLTFVRLKQRWFFFSFSNNFLKLNIYYEDLNFQNITEEPEIAVRCFLYILVTRIIFKCIQTFVTQKCSPTFWSYLRILDVVAILSYYSTLS